MARWLKAVVFTGIAMLSVASAPSVPAEATSAGHYYFEAGGTGDAARAPGCTSSYVYANRTLSRGIAVPVCYPAGAGPFVGGIRAPSYDASVARGYTNMLRAVEHAYRAHRDARFTITGYSQGAQVAGEVLQAIASGRAGIPKAHVDGMLYGDPRQPGTGIESIVPRGVSAFGFTSRGPEPVNFSGIRVRHFCIRTDGVCDARSVLGLYGYLTRHADYPKPGGIMVRTLAHDGGRGTTWYSPGS